MTLNHILLFIGLALGYRVLVPPRWRGWALLLASVIMIYWLQPALPVRRLDFLLPSLTLAAAVWVWVAARPAEKHITREDAAALGMVVALVLGITLTRYLAEGLRPTPSRPPGLDLVLPVLALVLGLVIAWELHLRRFRLSLLFMQGLILLLLVLTKYEPLTTAVSAFFRGAAGQSTTLARAIDIRWLGFSYVAFRLLHVLRDYQTGRLPVASLREHLTYVIFFPAFTAGPIDRLERHLEDDRALPSLARFDGTLLVQGGERIALGVFKKFVVADTLGLVALNSVNAEQAVSSGALWLLLYLYAFQLFFDFSGYSDIAIGLGYLYGIRLPENFNYPFFKQNITAFWQSWHITLSNWARFYVFSPLSRELLRRRVPSTLAVLSGHLCTMLVIGLWHGVTLNFAIWGLWHGLGLFGHKLWSDATRKTYRQVMQNPRRVWVWRAVGVLLTFHFVLLGWVWFALGDFETALHVFWRLWGLG